MSIHTAGWAILGSALTAIISVVSTSYSNYKSRSQTVDAASATLRQAVASLDVQRTSTVRTAATFIADKRQKWIDELRADMAAHLAESQEYLWKWDGVRQRCAELASDSTIALAERTAKTKQLVADFSDKNGVIDRSHQERHHRLRFRLNPNEPSHSKLRDHLDEIREIFDDTARAKDRETAIALIARVAALVGEADTLTNQILKTEWERVKQEVAYPEKMIAKIPPLA
ncbi:hypothetical protein [Burkholderia territorii]|uniref:hypothetical protein n=1 Tax=Burkholderia territorii TaxID=1503055 RepID=UPI000758A48B|nr:hypothetical protein [Burkholderia territorii]